MKFNKNIIMLLLALFIFSIASVSAGEMNDNLIGADQIALSSNNLIAEDNVEKKPTKYSNTKL